MDPPVSATSYKRADFEEREENFPNFIFPEFLLHNQPQTSSRSSIEDPKELLSKIEARIEDRRPKAAIKRRISRFLFIKMMVRVSFELFFSSIMSS